MLNWLVGMLSCTCWVASEPIENAFYVRHGAHNPQCPLYRESLDPVDRANDDELRRRIEEGVSGQ